MRELWQKILIKNASFMPTVGGGAGGIEQAQTHDNAGLNGDHDQTTTDDDCMDAVEEEVCHTVISIIITN